MKKSKVLGVSLLLWAVFGLVGCSFGADEKEQEIVPDPLAEVEYYIVGKVTDLSTSTPLSGVAVSAGSFSATTAADGTYAITVKSKTKYAMAFAKDSYLPVNINATIASAAPNRTVLNVSVKLGKKGPVKTVNDAGAEVGNKIEISESDVVLTVPAGAIPAGQSADMSITQYQQPLEVSTTVTSGSTTLAVPLDGLHVESTITNFLLPVQLTWRNICSADVIFKEVTVWSKNTTSKAADTRMEGYTKEGLATGNNGNYHFQTTQLKSDYILEVYADLNTGAQKTEANLVNGQTSVKVDNSGSMSAIVDYPLSVEVKTGWDYLTTPTQALTAIGISGGDITNMATTIGKVIESVEVASVGYSTHIMELLSSISGGYVMYYRNDAKYVERVYTFDVVIKGGKNQQAVVKVKKYVGNVPTYTNTDARQHSGGKL